MSNDGFGADAVAMQLIRLCMSQLPVQAFNRQFVRLVADAVGGAAVRLWLARENELVLCEQIEEHVGALNDLHMPEERRQEALHSAFDNGSVTVLQDGAGEFDPFNPQAGRSVLLAFVPLMGLHGKLGVLGVLLDGTPGVSPHARVRLAELLSGYYSLYDACRIVAAQSAERGRIDRLSKTALQLQHYFMSHQLPEVAVNSAMEVAGLDRAVLLTRKGRDDLEVKAVSSVSAPDRKGAWSRLVCEMGESILRRGEPLHYSRGVTALDSIEDAELRGRLSSYGAMTDVTTLLAYPLQSGDRDHGVLLLETFKDSRLTDFERDLCAVYASHVASALGNHELFLSLPFSGLIARRIDKEGERTTRGPGKLGKVVKRAVALLVAAGIVYLVGFYPVQEKIGASCFVEPEMTRVVTARVAGEIQGIYFELGDTVSKSALLVRLRTDQIELELSTELSNAKNIEATITKLRGEAEQTRDAEKRSSLLAEVQVLGHSLAARKETVELLRSRLADFRLVAPISGTVLEPAEPQKLLGVVVREGEPLCRIGSIAPTVKVRIAVPAQHVDRIEEGQEVEIRLRPLVAQKVLRGTIGKVAERSVTYKNANVFMADVVVHNPLAGSSGEESKAYLLKPGMTGKARIIQPGESTYFAIYGKMLYRRMKYWLY